MDALFDISSEHGAGCDDINALGQQLLILPCSCNGNLQSDVPLSNDVAQKNWHLPNFQVHQAYGTKELQSHCWRIDGEQCKVIPSLTFDKMPREVAAVRAQMACRFFTMDKDVHHSLLHTLYHKGSPTDNQAVRRFVCDGGVNAAAWSSSSESGLRVCYLWWLSSK